MAQPNIFQRYVENLLKSYDIVEVGQFLSDQNILSEKELNMLKTRLLKKEIICFLTQLLDGDSSRLELFRKAIMKFAMDTMYQTINQLSDWSPSQTCLLSSEKSRSYNTDRLVHGHPDTTVLFSDHDAETLTHNPVTTDQYSQVVHCVSNNACRILISIERLTLELYLHNYCVHNYRWLRSNSRVCTHSTHIHPHFSYTQNSSLMLLVSIFQGAQLQTHNPIPLKMQLKTIVKCAFYYIAGCIPLRMKVHSYIIASCTWRKHTIIIAQCEIRGSTTGAVQLKQLALD